MKHHSYRPAPRLWEMPNHCLHFSTPPFPTVPRCPVPPAAPWHGLQHPPTVPTKSMVSPYRACRPSQRQPSWNFATLDRLLEAVQSSPGLLVGSRRAPWGP